MTRPRFRTGIETIGRRLAGRRVGLLTHAAALTVPGASSVEALLAGGARLAALFGPEHGFFAAGGGAGGAHTIRRHPVWGAPLRSLYGPARAPDPAAFRGLEALVIDLQDIGARCYTYLSTLRQCLEAAGRAGLPVVVADRPIPLPVTPDGPTLDPAFESFVGALRLPMATAMTPAEAAFWIRADLGLDTPLTALPMRGWARAARRGPDWPPWAPPSPAIRSWESAACFLTTVFTEALPAVRCSRTEALPFQLVGAPWLKTGPMLDELRAARLPGAAFHPHPYVTATEPGAGRLLPAIRIVATDPLRFRPVLVSVAILAALQRHHGRRRLWNGPGVRPGWFDKLYGTDQVRLALLDGESPAAIAARWKPGLARFRNSRARVRLYPDP